MQRQFSGSLTASAILLYLFSISSAIAQSPGPILLSSPSGQLRASIFVDTSHRLGWSLTLKGRPVVGASAMGIDIAGKDPQGHVGLDAPVLSTHHSSYPWKGVHAVATDHYRQAVIAVRHKGNGLRYSLECRIFDGGFAFRYVVPSGGLVTGESSSWHVPDGSRVWYQENVYYYEGLHYTRPIADMGSRQLGPPVTYQTAAGDYACITEAALYNYSGMSLHSDSAGTLHAGFINDPQGWQINGAITTPWRVVLVSENLDGLVNSDIVADLNPAPPAGDLSWIRPGRAVWSYFVHDNVTTLDLEKTYVDKAAELGFEYSIVDAGWDSSWPNTLDSLRSLVRYAGRHHIGIFVWKSYASLQDSSVRKAFFRTMHEAGVAGLKIDYIDKEGIEQVRFYEKALQDALAFHLLIDFHGANKPTGYNRRWPNEITREGIYGQEWRTYTPQGAINNAIIPFTRFLAGPADYTPGVFTSSLAYGTSRAQQLALPIIYSSPLLCWADDPARYLSSPAAGLIRAIPVIWDETRVLAPSKIGELVIFARRKGKDWYLGIINAGDERRLVLPLNFLGAGNFRGEIIADDLRSSDSLLHSVSSFSTGDSLHITLLNKGGLAARFTSTESEAVPLAIVPAGSYLQGPQKVRIVSKPGAEIRYTTDGSEPGPQSPSYKAPLVVSSPVLLRARTKGADVVAQFLTAPAPVTSPSGGIFVGQDTIRLLTRLAGSIRYTTDGSDPVSSSPLYASPIVLHRSTRLKSRVFFTAGGVSEIATQDFQQVAPDTAQTANTIGRPGLTYTYYEGKWDSMPRFNTLTPVKQGLAGAVALDSLPARPNEYGLRFEGWIDIPETGVYSFYTVSDDGSLLYIDDRITVDNDGCHGDLERSGDRALATGKHVFRLDYFQNGSGQTLQVYIKGPHMEKQIIPAALFSTP
ncbi:MAG: hypothetical protein BGO55_09260 [Sphingobacteriales bacterium 50-39]|nr:glycoside hydrolase family 97 catalytic domain-containing protein [Sphingobacteriales bacterium]OJW57734.1 MAG: hypothetical protein BGO55_09260 [Sphingobacteriales bacterium 50-39]